MQFSLKIFEELSSTNNYLKQLSETRSLQEGVVIVARKQTRGYGQKKAPWISQPYKDLAMSLFLKPDFLNASDFFLMNVFVSLALFETLKHFLPSPDIKIKWSNDLLVNDKKIAGILIENRFLTTKLLDSVIGIGLNINSESFPRNLSYKFPPTSMFLEARKEFPWEEVLNRLLSELGKHYEILKTSPDVLRKQYENLLWGKKQTLRFKTSYGEEFSGNILGITSSGGLRVLVKSNEERVFYSKEVEFETF